MARKRSGPGGAPKPLHGEVGDRRKPTAREGPAKDASHLHLVVEASGFQEELAAFNEGVDRAVAAIADPEAQDLTIEAKEIAELAATIIEQVESIPQNRRTFFLSRLCERIGQGRWDKKNKQRKERLAFLIAEAERTKKELEGADGAEVLEGVSHAFEREGAKKFIEASGHGAGTALKVGIAGLEFGVSTSMFIGLFKALGVAVPALSIPYFTSLGAAALVLGYAERSKIGALSGLAEGKGMSPRVMFLLAAAASLPIANSVQFMATFGMSAQAADTVAKMRSAIDGIREELSRIRVSEDETVSELEALNGRVEGLFADMIRAEASGVSRPGVGGSGVGGAGPNTAVKEGITGVHPVAVSAEIANRPDVRERIRAARARINEQMRALGEEFVLGDDESIPEALQRYVARFGEHTEENFLQLEGHRQDWADAAGAEVGEGEYADLTQLGDELQHHSEPLVAKIDTALAVATRGAPDLRREQTEIHAVIADMVLKYHDDVGVPMQTLLAAVADEMNRLGDPSPIDVEAPEFNPSTSALDDVTVPQANFDADLIRSVMVDHFGTQGVWVLLFTLLAFSGLAAEGVRERRLHKSQKREIEDRKVRLYGEGTAEGEEGIELQRARKIAEAFTGQLYSANGYLASEGIKALLPFKSTDINWFQLSPLEVIAAVREQTGKDFRPLDAAPDKNALEAAKRLYGEGAAALFDALPESDETKALNLYIRNLITSSERTALAVEAQAMPGLARVMELGSELAAMNRKRAGTEGKVPQELAEKAREFQGALLKMAFNHIAFRSRVSRTVISEIRWMYGKLKGNESFTKLDFKGLTEIPKDISFDLLSDEPLPDSLTSDLLRGSALRSVTIELLDRRLVKEQAKLGKLDERMDMLLQSMNSLHGRQGAEDKTFKALAAKARSELDLAKREFSVHPNEALARLSTRGGIGDFIMEDIQAMTRRRMNSQTGQGGTEYDAREQLAAIRSVMKRAVQGYTHTTAQLLRREGGEKNVADYLAIVVRVGRDTGDTRRPPSVVEFPLRSVLGAGYEPEAGARTVEKWFNGVAPYLKIAQRFEDVNEELNARIAELSSQTGTEAGKTSISLASPDAGTRIAAFYQKTLPQLLRARDLDALRVELAGERGQFTERSRKQLSPEDYRAFTSRLNTFTRRRDELIAYPHDYTARLEQTRTIIGALRDLPDVRATFETYNPRTNEARSSEEFKLERAVRFQFLNRDKPITATIEEVERALGDATPPRNFADLSKKLGKNG